MAAGNVGGRLVGLQDSLLKGQPDMADVFQFLLGNQ